MGCGQNQVRLRFLHRWRRHHRISERSGDCGRLHVGGFVSGHFSGRDGIGLRRPDLLHRLPGGLAHHHLPDGRAPAQPGQVHLCRRGRLPLSARPHPCVCRFGHAGGGGFLPDRTDGWCRPAHQAAVWPGILDGRGHRGRVDDGLRAVWRHDCHDLGADHQGRDAFGGRDLHGLHGAGAVRLQPRGAFCQGR